MVPRVPLLNYNFLTTSLEAVQFFCSLEGCVFLGKRFMKCFPKYFVNQNPFKMIPAQISIYYYRIYVLSVTTNTT